MTLFEKNLSICKQNNAELYNLISGLNGVSHENIKIFPARSLSPTMQVERNGSLILLHSAYDPSEEASRFASSFSIDADTKVVFVFGVGLGYHVVEILRKLPPRARLILFEKDARILKQAMQAVDFSFLNDSRVSLFCGEFNMDNVQILIYPLFYPKIPDEKGIVMVPHLASMQLYPEYYHALREKIKDSISQFMVVVSTHVFVSPKWSVNILKNIAEIIKGAPAACLYGKNNGKPAIVVSAGPSLNKNIHLLKDAQNKALIIAVGTTLKPLLKNGVRPHLVVALDASKKHYEHFRGAVIPDGAALVCDPMIYPRILDEAPGAAKFLCDTCDTPIKSWLYSYFGEYSTIDSGFSVATTAFSLARNMGSSPIILIGQDLAYAGDGRTHADGTTWENSVADLNSAFNVRVRGNMQEEVYTNHVFLSVLRWFERTLKGVSALCINATEGGARIEGTKTMALKDALSSYCQEELSFDFIRTLGNKNAPDAETFKRFLADVQNAVKNIRSMRDKAAAGARAAQALLDALTEGLDTEGEAFQKKAQGVQTLVDELRAHDGSQFIDPWMQEVYLFLHRTQDGLKELEEQSVTVQEINRAGVLFEGLYKAASEALPLLDAAAKKARSAQRGIYGMKEKKKLRVLVFSPKEGAGFARYAHEDFAPALQRLGHAALSMKNAESAPDDVRNVRKILSLKPDMVFAFDGKGIEPDMLDAVNAPVLNFCMENPSPVQTNADLTRANHYIFSSERNVALAYKEEEFYNVYFVSPGGSPERFFYKNEAQDTDAAACDVSFAAFSNADGFASFERLPEETKSLMERVLEAQSSALNLPLERVIQHLELTAHFDYQGHGALERGFRFLTQKASTLHRLTFLKRIPKGAHFKLFGDAGWKDVFPDAPYFGMADYGTELVNVYNASKINLGLNRYGTGEIPQCVLDIALCKAFGLYEYAPGMERYFANGEDIAWFKTPEEMDALIAHYLACPGERARIAENAYKNVTANHTTAHRVKEMLDIVTREME